MQSVLITGASGFIGRLICPHLQAHGFRLRAFDKSTECVVAESVCGSIEDLSVLRMAARGMDAIIHLAACADEADFPTQLVPANVIGIHNALEAARTEGVKRFIYASSCQTANVLGHRDAIGTDARFPTDLYGLTKLWGEDMGRMYSQRYGMSILAARLGWVVRNQAELDEMTSIPAWTTLYLSHRDARRFFLCSLLAESQPFAVVYALSKSHPPVFDMKPAQEIVGFRPMDRFPEGLEPGFRVKCGIPV